MQMRRPGYSTILDGNSGTSLPNEAAFKEDSKLNFFKSVLINRNRNLKTAKALLKRQAHQGTSLFTSAAANQRGFSRRVVKRSTGPISRIPGRDRVAVKVGVSQMERVSAWVRVGVFEEMRL